VSPGSIIIPVHCCTNVHLTNVDTDRQRAHRSRQCDRLGTWSMNFSGAGRETSRVQLSSSIHFAVIAVEESVGLTLWVVAIGASHNTQITNRSDPSGMIFVPRRNNGITNALDEFGAAREVNHGVDLLVRSLLALDG